MNPRTGRIDGAWMMKQIYDDLGIYRDIDWHAGSRDSNVAHNWNDGDSWNTIFRKLQDGSGEWDKDIDQAIRRGDLTRSTVASAFKHYSTFSVDSQEMIPSAEHVIAADKAVDAAYTKDHWTGKISDFQVEGKKGLDISPHESALDTWYATERMDHGLKEEIPGTGTISGMKEVMENIEAKFLDEVYNTEAPGAPQVREGVEAHWGLDLRRVGLGHGVPPDDMKGSWLNKIVSREPSKEWKDVDVRSPEYYEQLTKGDVNWAAYQNDTKYIAAFKEMADKWATDDDDSTDAAYWDITTLGEDISQIADDVGRIRQVNKETDVLEKTIRDDGDGWKYDWEGKYDEDKVVYNGKDLWIEGKKQERPSEMYGIDPDTGKPKNRLLDPADYPIEHDPIVGPVTPVVKPDIKIPNVKVKRPANIPGSWGAV